MQGVHSSTVDDEPDFSGASDLEKDPSTDPTSQVYRLKSFVMNEPGQSYDRCFQIAKATGQFRLVAALLFNDRCYKGSDCFDLITICPRRYISGIVEDSSRFDQSVQVSSMIQNLKPANLAAFQPIFSSRFNHFYAFDIKDS